MDSEKITSVSRRSWAARFDRFLFTGFVVSIALLVFCAGIIVGHYELPPYRMLHNAKLALDALWYRHKLRSERYPEFLWIEPGGPDKNIVTLDKERMQPGLTLYTDGHAQQAVLIDEQGVVVHRWSRRFSEVFPDPPHIDSPSSDHQIWIREGVVLPTGDLLVLYVSATDTPVGYGVVKLDQNSRVLWASPIRAHHDFDVGPEGRIYALTHEMRTTPYLEAPHWQIPDQQDWITILSADGETLKSFSIYDAFRSSEFTFTLNHIRNRPGYYSDDITHANTIHVIGPGFAARHEGIEPGFLMTFFRNPNICAIVDPEAEKVVWTRQWPIGGAHDSQPLENGRVLVFDNLRHLQGTGPSRVVEIEPDSGAAIWVYDVQQPKPFNSRIRSGVQRLANGNTLITSSSQGRIIEVTPAGQTVWEFVIPVRSDDGRNLIPVAGTARRYARSELRFLQEAIPANGRL